MSIVRIPSFALCKVSFPSLHILFVIWQQKLPPNMATNLSYKYMGRKGTSLFIALSKIQSQFPMPNKNHSIQIFIGAILPPHKIDEHLILTDCTVIMWHCQNIDRDSRESKSVTYLKLRAGQSASMRCRPSILWRRRPVPLRICTISCWIWHNQFSNSDVINSLSHPHQLYKHIPQCCSLLPIDGLIITAGIISLWSSIMCSAKPFVNV